MGEEPMLGKKPPDAPQRASSRDQRAGARIARPPRILVIDDEIDILRSTGLLLEGLGYDIIMLSEADKILETAAKEHPEMILLDLRMPGLDIDTLVPKIRENATTSKIPIVLFSAYPDVGQRAAKVDAEAYLNKPFTESQLTDVLKQVLGPAPMSRRAAHLAPNIPADPAMLEERREAVREYFHDYWNTLTALTNYSQFISSSENLNDGERRAAQEIGRLLLDLEQKTDALRGQLLEYVG